MVIYIKKNNYIKVIEYVGRKNQSKFGILR